MILKQLLLIFAVLCGAQAKFWVEEIDHLGISPYHPEGSSYQIFRNVKDFGAIGDGVSDDTDAINAAIAVGNRCNPGHCNGSVVSPATVYFPSGTYLISGSIIDLYYTQLIGDATNLPIIKASGAFPNGSFGLIDSNPYQPGGLLAWKSTDTFFRQIRNFIFDTTSIPSYVRAVAIHWPSSQATSITNCVFQLSTEPGNNHIGIFIEEGSGGLLNDLYFYGGAPAVVFGNQQYTARNLWFFNAQVAINMKWNWGWTYKNIHFKDCEVGMQMDDLQASIGSVTLLDSTFDNVGTAIVTTRNTTANRGTNGTLAMENVQFTDVQQVVVGPDGPILGYEGARQGPNDLFIMGHIMDQIGLSPWTGYYNLTSSRQSSLLDEQGMYYERSKPQYEDIPAQNFLSARRNGAKGDGVTDDTNALNNLFSQSASSGDIAYLDAGTYVVTNTIYIPAKSKIVGEALASVIMAAGPTFSDMNKPRPVVMVGRPGEVGSIEWSDTLVSTRGALCGAVLIQYNLFSPTTPSGMWDVHTRIGGFPGTDLQLLQCPAIKHTDIVNENCVAAFLSMHITVSAGGLFTENCWLWVADHDLEDQQYRRVTIYAGRGLLVESQRGRIWLSATGAEHHVLYQYQLANTRDIYMGHVQTESPYFQPLPLARYPFPPIAAIRDPDFLVQCEGKAGGEPCETAWGMRVLDSENIAVHGAGFYSFFDSYSDGCSRRNSTRDCQQRLVSIHGTTENTKILGLSTVGAKVMVERNGLDLVPAAENNSSFADTLALYRI